MHFTARLGFAPTIPSTAAAGFKLPPLVGENQAADADLTHGLRLRVRQGRSAHHKLPAIGTTTGCRSIPFTRDRHHGVGPSYFLERVVWSSYGTSFHLAVCVTGNFHSILESILWSVVTLAAIPRFVHSAGQSSVRVHPHVQP